MSTNIARKQDLGIPGNGGQFASRHRSEPSFALTVPGAPQNSAAPGGLRMEQGTVLRAPDGEFSPEDAASDWGRQAVLAGALRRFGVSRQDHDKALALMHNQHGDRSRRGRC